MRAQEIIDIARVPPPLVIHAADPDDDLGLDTHDAFAFGDVSGDGVPDLALGLEFGDGPANTRRSAGEVAVLFGPFEPGFERDLATPAPDLLIFGGTQDAFFARGLLIADLNADGIGDLVVGDRNSRRPDATDTRRGQASIFFGPLAAGTVDLLTDSPDLRILGGRRSDLLGSALAAGDVSGDGITDLVVSGPTATFGSGEALGGVWVFHGPLVPGPDRIVSDVPADVTIVGAAPSYFGNSLAVGDVSADGLADIVVSAPLLTDASGRAEIGRGYIVFGGLPTGTTLDLRTAPADAEVHGRVAGEVFGMKLAIADLTGDGNQDLIAASERAPSALDGSRGAGVVQIVFGPITSGTIVDNVARLADVVLTGRSGNSLGQDLDVASFPGGTWRLALSTPSEFADCYPSGSVSILDTLPSSGSVVDVHDVPPSIRITSSSGGDLLGLSIMYANLWGDDEPELLTSLWTDGPAGDRTDAGSLRVVPFDDRCELPPADLGPAGLFVRRSGDDVLLDFDDSGLGPDRVGVDVYRGLVRDLYRWYTHDVLPDGCGTLDSPFADIGAAAPRQPTFYYLATRGCPDACSPFRLTGGLGFSSTGPRPDRAVPRNAETCR